MKKRIVLLVFAVIVVAAVAFIFVGQWWQSHGDIYYSGTLEARDSRLAFQTSGRVLGVDVKEGQAVTKDQILARLDAAELKSRQAQAQAALERSASTVAQLETLLGVYTGTLPADVTRSEASLSAAQKTYQDAKRNWERYEGLYARRVIAEKERDAVKLQHDTAQSRLADSEAQVKQAVSSLRKIDATRRDIEAAKAQVRLARATLDQAAIQTDYALLRAPFAGIITSRNIEPGEVVTPSREVLTLVDLSTIELKIFVDETQIGTVKPGQAAEVKIDTFPGKTYRGTVAFVSPEGEFTPKTIQTKKERVKLVYLVRILLPNPDLELKTGMPADAWLK